MYSAGQDRGRLGQGAKTRVQIKLAFRRAGLSNYCPPTFWAHPAAPPLQENWHRVWGAAAQLPHGSIRTRREDVRNAVI